MKNFVLKHKKKIFFILGGIIVPLQFHAIGVIGLELSKTPYSQEIFTAILFSFIFVGITRLQSILLFNDEEEYEKYLIEKIKTKI